MSLSVDNACASDKILFARLDGKDSASPPVASSKACTYASEDCTMAKDSHRRARSITVKVAYVLIDGSHIVDGKKTLHYSYPQKVQYSTCSTYATSTLILGCKQEDTLGIQILQY